MTNKPGQPLQSPSASGEAEAELNPPRGLLREVTQRAITEGEISDPIRKPVQLLTDEQLDAPLEDDFLDGESVTDGLPSLKGFHITEKLSQGGQASVYLGSEPTTGRPVAIKVLPVLRSLERNHRERFIREATILAKLDHPNVVGILARGRSESGEMYLVMPLVEGVSLDVYWASPPPVGPTKIEQLIGVFIAIARAIHEVHRSGVIHRDLKPSNVRIDRFGIPHILDFGLARITGSQPQAGLTVTETGQFVGSLPWACPEQVTGKKDELDERSDVYSLGVMLYQAFAGRFPYDVSGPVSDVLRNIAQVRPSSPGAATHRLAPHDPDKLDAVVLKTLAKNPTDRYQSMEALADDLANYLSHQRVSVRFRSKRRRRIMAVGAVAILLANLGLWSWIARHTPVMPEVTVVDLPSTTNSLGMKLIEVLPQKVFLSESSPIAAGLADRTYRSEITTPYWVSTTKVTQAQYHRLMDQPPAADSRDGDDLPVENITWLEANEFCRRLSLLEHQSYRLPTELEWECAACGGLRVQTVKIPPEHVAWIAKNSGSRLHPLGKLLPNPWGLYDVLGDVSEYCSDSWVVARTDSAVAPTTGPFVRMHPVRGCGIDASVEQCNISHRHAAAEETRSGTIGFRIVRD